MTTELRTEPVFDALKQPLGLLESDDRRRQVETYIEAARVPVERAVHDLMSQLVSAIDEQIGDQYRIRLAYRPGGLALEVDEKVQNGDEARWTGMEGDVEKITIRIPAELKDLATQAAARAGTSANSWFIKAMARAIRSVESGPPPGRPDHRWHNERHGRGSRLSGWIGDDDR
jgi:hypothetical protein